MKLFFYLINKIKYKTLNISTSTYILTYTKDIGKTNFHSNNFHNCILHLQSTHLHYIGFEYNLHFFTTYGYLQIQTRGALCFNFYFAIFPLFSNVCH